MNVHPNPPRRKMPQLLSEAFSAAAAGLGLLALIGWSTGHLVLASFGENLIPMAPSTALIFLLLGLALLSRSRYPSNRVMQFTHMATGSLTALAALVLFSLSSAHIYTAVEYLGFPVSGTLNGIPIGHMAPLTALLSVIIAVSFLLTLSSSSERPKRAVAALVLTGALGLTATALVMAYMLGTPLMYGGEFIPPALPTSLSCLLLALAIVTQAGVQVWPPGPLDATREPRVMQAPVVVFFVLTSGILIIGYAYHHKFEKQYRLKVEQVLGSVADLKVSELVQWRKERLSDASVFQGNAAFSSLVDRTLHEAESGEARTELLAWLRKVREGYQYDRVCLYDADFAEIVSTPNGPDRKDSLFVQGATLAMSSREIVFQDFYRDTQTGNVYLKILIPIPDRRKGDRVIALVAMRIDPGRYIYPLLERWPTPQRTAETLLIRREENAVLFLNDLRFRKDAALTLRISLDSMGITSVKAAHGQVGIVEGRDYQGASVIADVRPVPDSPWFLVAGMDRSEVYADLNERLWITVAFMCALLLGTISVVGLLWRQQRVRYYRDQYIAERERAWLHDVIERSLNEIYVFDPHTLRFKFVNTGAQRNLGFSTRELADLTPLDTNPEYTEHSFRAMLEPIHSGKQNLLVLESLHRRKDGSRYPVESHIRLVERPEGSVYLAIVNDITERKVSETVLKESEERFHQLFDESPVGYHELDIHGRIVVVNHTELGMLGYTAEEMLGHPIWEFLVDGEASREAVVGKMEGALSSDQAYEQVIRRKDGETLEVLLNDRALRDAEGGIIGIRSTLQDITRQKGAERELRLMAQAFSSTTDCIYIADLENNFIFVNDSFQRAYGYSGDELYGKSVDILRSPGTAKETVDQITRATLKGGWYGEIVNRRKDGSEFPVELWTSIVKDDADTLVAMVGVARDITQRKIADDKIRQSEEQFRLISENVADMIAVLDLDGKRIYNSPSYEKILGDPNALKGTDGFLEIHHEDREKVRRVFQETVRTGLGQRMQYRFLLKDGSERMIESKGSVMREPDGTISKVVVVSRDVTEEKKLEEQFFRAQRMESIGTLAAGIAHDLNNVLAPIMMAIEILRSKMSDSSGTKLLATIETSAKRGSDIIRQVLAFGRGVKGDHIVMQLKHVADEVVKVAEQTFAKSIVTKADIPRNLWTVMADPTQIHQVLLNIMVNARDAMPNGGELTISAENIELDKNYSRMHLEAKPGRYVAIAITDTGTGIPANLQGKVFDPFFTTKEIGKGTGLGLSTTLAIVRSHGGFINLYSEAGKGTTFRIYLPASGMASTAAEADGHADLPAGHGELILIIDDEEAIREITKETLDAYGYTTMTASDGAGGVALYAKHQDEISAIITDIMMPVMDGTATIRVLRNMNPEVIIIAASGLMSNEHAVEVSEFSVQAFLTKPYTAEKLLNVLAAALR